MTAAQSPDSEDLSQEIVIQIEPATPDQYASARNAFTDLETLTSRGFSGQEVISVIAKPGAVLFKKLAGWLFAGPGKGVKTKLVIGAKEMSLEGYTAAEVERLIESPQFLRVLREARKT